MAFDFAEMQATADDLIGEFGMPGAIRRSTTTGGGPYDPDGGTITVTDHPCMLVVDEYGLRERESSLIEANDRKVLVAVGGLTVEPQEEDQIVIGGAVFEIVSVKPIAPAGVVVLYEIQARS